LPIILTSSSTFENFSITNIRTYREEPLPPIVYEMDNTTLEFRMKCNDWLQTVVNKWVKMFIDISDGITTIKSAFNIKFSNK
jgi:hypothetical protein